MIKLNVAAPSLPSPFTSRRPLRRSRSWAWERGRAKKPPQSRLCTSSEKEALELIVEVEVDLSLSVNLET